MTITLMVKCKKETLILKIIQSTDSHREGNLQHDIPITLFFAIILE